MSKPLTIWRCPECGSEGLMPFTGDHVSRAKSFTRCGVEPIAEVYYPTEDVRLLFMAVLAGAAFGGLSGSECAEATNRFPAPESWR